MYSTFYGLRELPFNITPDPRYLYLNDCYQEAIAALAYGIEARKGFLSLIGEAGTGKTTLLRRLLDTLEPNVRSVLLLHPTVGFDEVLEHILQELGIPTEGARKLARLQRLNEFLLENTRGGGNVVLLIDEAQDLDPTALEELRLLSNLETGREKILQIVLAGQPELEVRLGDPALRQLRQRITLHIRLRALSPAEVAEYVRARLAYAGARDAAIFTADALARIAQCSGGIPRIVNVLCDASLMAGFAAGKNPVTGAIVDEAWADYCRSLPPAPAAPSVPTPVPVASPPPAAASATPVPPPPADTTPTPVTAPTPAPEPPRAPAPGAPSAPARAPAPASAAEPVVAARTWPPPPRRSTSPPRRTAGPRLLSLSAAAMLVVALAAVLYALSRRDESGFASPPVVEPLPPSTASAPRDPVAPPPPERIRPHAEAAPPVPPPAVAASEAPPAPAASPTPPPAAGETAASARTDPPARSAPRATLSPAEATFVTEEFRLAYEARDLDRLRGLFSADAVENSRRGRAEVLAGYQRVFRSRSDIDFQMPSLQIEQRGDAVIVRGPFTTRYHKPDGSVGHLNGWGEWQIERRQGQPQIVAFTYRLANGRLANGRRRSDRRNVDEASTTASTTSPPGAQVEHGD